MWKLSFYSTIPVTSSGHYEWSTAIKCQTSVQADQLRHWPLTLMWLESVQVDWPTFVHVAWHWFHIRWRSLVISYHRWPFHPCILVANVPNILHTQLNSFPLLLTAQYVVNSFTRFVVLETPILVPVVLSQTPAYTDRLQTWGQCITLCVCLLPSH